MPIYDYCLFLIPCGGNEGRRREGNLRKREEEGRYDDVDEQYRRPASLPLCIWAVCLCVENGAGHRWREVFWEAELPRESLYMLYSI